MTTIAPQIHANNAERYTSQNSTKTSENPHEEHPADGANTSASESERRMPSDVIDLPPPMTDEERAKYDFSSIVIPDVEPLWKKGTIHLESYDSSEDMMTALQSKLDGAKDDISGMFIASGMSVDEAEAATSSLISEIVSSAENSETFDFTLRSDKTDYSKTTSHYTYSDGGNIVAETDHVIQKNSTSIKSLDIHFDKNSGEMSFRSDEVIIQVGPPGGKVTALTTSHVPRTTGALYTTTGLFDTPWEDKEATSGEFQLEFGGTGTFSRKVEAEESAATMSYTTDADSTSDFLADLSDKYSLENDARMTELQNLIKEEFSSTKAQVTAEALKNATDVYTNYDVLDLIDDNHAQSADAQGINVIA